MRNLVLSILLVVPLLAMAANAENFAVNSNFDSMGFSSEESAALLISASIRGTSLSDRLATLHLKEERGVEITMVDQDAPAGKAGLKEQDVILTLNGEPVESVEQFRRMIRETPPDEW